MAKTDPYERQYQADLIQHLRDIYPDAVILKNDSAYLQGVPDWTIFNGDRWAMLEIKRNAKARTRPNQPYYVDKFDAMSFAAFIYPENEEEVLRGLQQSLQPERPTRIPRR